VAAHAAPAFNINLGDLPTWLGVLAASVAALFVYLQLRAQQKQLGLQQQELTRQLRAIERQQADDIDIAHGFASLGLTQDGRPVNQQCWEVYVLNSSHRPIRNVVAKIEPVPGDVLSPADYRATGHANDILGLEKGDSVDVLRRTMQATFAFKVPSGNTRKRR
jgi:hypothetical protein